MALPYPCPRNPSEVMRNKRFVTATVWVVVIGMILSLALAVIGFFR